MSIKTYFIAGFLGAGKTTLLNNLLEDLSDKKLALIINEFGQINIDAKFVKYRQGMEVAEINNGSIFCNCLSGSFIKNIIQLSKYQPDLLLVESSGMARPASVGTILKQVEEQKKGVIDYQGMITIIDASNYLKLVKSVNAVREQVIYSDLLIINKTDLVDEDIIIEIEKSIFTFNPGVKIIKTVFARVEDVLSQNYCNSVNQYRKPLDECGNDKGMFKVLLQTEDRVLKEDFTKFIKEILPYVFRIKGLVYLEDNIVHVDCVTDELKIDIVKVKNFEIETSHLVFISNNKDLRESVEKEWTDIVKVKYSIS